MQSFIGLALMVPEIIRGGSQLMYIAASLDPDANPMGGGQLPSPKSAMYANEYKETLSPNPNECNSTLTSGTSQGAALDF